MNLTPPPPSQNSHAVRWHCTAESERRVAEIKSWFLCRRSTDQQACDRVLLRHNGIERRIQFNTHTHTDTYSKKIQKDKNSKKEQNWWNKCDIRPTLLCWRMCPIRSGLLFAGWRESTTNRTDSQLQQSFLISNVTKRNTYICSCDPLMHLDSVHRQIQLIQEAGSER